jgi:hypothetical protein
MMRETAAKEAPEARRSFRASVSAEMWFFFVHAGAPTISRG